MTLRRITFMVWRTLCGLLLALLGLAAALIATVWWLNRQDDALRPEVQAAQAFTPPSADAMRRNGYFTMTGLNAPPDQDAHAAGVQFFGTQLQAYEAFRRSGDFSATTAPPFEPVSIERMAPVRCTAEVADCYAHYRQKADVVAERLKAHALLITRYLSLHEAPAYEEVMPPHFGVQFPYYQDVVAASELVGAQAALAWQAGRREEALALLETNHQIHRRLWGGARTVIGAMIALAADYRQQRLLAGLLRDVAPGHNAAWARLQALSAPWPDMTGVMAGERNFSMAAYPSTWSGEWVDAAPFARVGLWPLAQLTQLSYLPHATANTAYDGWQQVIDLAALPADQLSARADRERAAWTQRIMGDGPLPWPLRNTMGHVLLGLGGPSLMLPYLERAHDVEGHRRLLRLAIAARRDGVAAADMPDWLARQPAELHDPYLQRPMGWDPGDNALVFDGRQAQTQNPEPTNVYRVRLHPAPG